MHAGKLIARALKKAGVECVFTLSGGHIMPIYEGCRHESVRLVDVRHEQAAGHAAEAWGRIKRSCGVATTTRSGRAATTSCQSVTARPGARTAASRSLARAPSRSAAQATSSPRATTASARLRPIRPQADDADAHDSPPDGALPGVSRGRPPVDADAERLGPQRQGADVRPRAVPGPQRVAPLAISFRICLRGGEAQSTALGTLLGRQGTTTGCGLRDSTQVVVRHLLRADGERGPGAPRDQMG